jgi:FtsP/CotA-like multicopper oxidase with cupredoxin domain
MSHSHPPRLSRRSFIGSAAAFAASAALPETGLAQTGGAAASIRQYRLQAAVGEQQVLPQQFKPLAVWSYNGSAPGPVLRATQGERLRIEFENALKESSTVHWHGVRLPHAMDGVAYLTQPPVKPGEKFVYEFDAIDAGTFWYHPHQRSYEQVDRGLYGALIINEKNPPRVDRDLVWVIDDWRVTREGAFSEDFNNLMDASHGGRLGNYVTVNGSGETPVKVRSNERIRLRLINTANARIFSLDFAGLSPWLIALDGQPVKPHKLDGEPLVLGPSMRADIMLDMTGKPGSRTAVIDRNNPRNPFRVADLVYDANPLRDTPPDWPMDLPPNPLQEPNIASAQRHTVQFTGGMMAGMAARRMGVDIGGSGGMGMGGGMMGMMRQGKIWFVNGVAELAHNPQPFLNLALGKSHVIELVNVTAWHHPIHLHGHSFRVITRNGKPTRFREWQDSVLMAPLERVEIALVADNPGKWMFHCHILEHQASGMMGVVNVA